MFDFGFFLTANEPPDLQDGEADHIEDDKENDEDHDVEFDVVVLDEGHVVVEWDLVADVELIDVVNPVLNVHLAARFVLQ